MKKDISNVNNEVPINIKNNIYVKFLFYRHLNTLFGIYLLLLVVCNFIFSFDYYYQSTIIINLILIINFYFAQKTNYSIANKKYSNISKYFDSFITGISSTAQDIKNSFPIINYNISEKLYFTSIMFFVVKVNLYFIYIIFTNNLYSLNVVFIILDIFSYIFSFYMKESLSKKYFV